MLHLRPQPVERQPLDEIGRASRRAIQKKPVAVLGHEELEQDLALGRQQRGIDPLPGAHSSMSLLMRPWRKERASGPLTAMTERSSRTDA